MAVPAHCGPSSVAVCVAFVFGILVEVIGTEAIWRRAPHVEDAVARPFRRPLVVGADRRASEPLGMTSG